MNSKGSPAPPRSVTGANRSPGPISGSADDVGESLTDLSLDHTGVAAGPLAKASYFIGGIGLIGATFTDTFAVAGRHLGIGLTGAIELVQAFVILLGASAMYIATATDNHASVHIFTDRMPPARRAMMRRVAAAFSALVFIVIVAGSAWIVCELWHAHEETELLHIPLLYWRIAWTSFATLMAVHFLARVFERSDVR